MSIRRKLEKKIREKESEIQELEFQTREARAYVQALQDTLRILPNEGDSEDTENESEVVIRPGSAIESAVKVLRDYGKPMQIMDLLRAMGRVPNPTQRASVGSSIAAYVRRNQVFTRPAPNTYGLLEWGAITPQPEPQEPPDDFGEPVNGLQ